MPAGRPPASKGRPGGLIEFPDNAAYLLDFPS